MHSQESSAPNLNKGAFGDRHKLGESFDKDADGLLGTGVMGHEFDDP